MTSYPGPVVQRALLITELRALRRQARMTEVDAAAALGWSPSRLARTENGAPQSLVEDLPTLLDFYQVDSVRYEVLQGLARASQEEGWWQPYAEAGIQ